MASKIDMNAHCQKYYEHLKVTIPNGKPTQDGRHKVEVTGVRCNHLQMLAYCKSVPVGDVVDMRINTLDGFHAPPVSFIKISFGEGLMLGLVFLCAVVFYFKFSSDLVQV